MIYEQKIIFWKRVKEVSSNVDSFGDMGKKRLFESQKKCPFPRNVIIYMDMGHSNLEPEEEENNIYSVTVEHLIKREMICWETTFLVT